jgi:hypothetical protein
MPTEKFAHVSGIVFLIFLAVCTLLIGYNLNGQSELTGSLQTLKHLEGNQFGLNDLIFKDGYLKVVVRSAPNSNSVIFYVPQDLTYRRLQYGPDTEQMLGVPLVAALTDIPGVTVTEMYTGQIVTEFEPRYPKGDLISRAVLVILSNLKK